MAQTKVKLISDGVIDVDHLASGHGITTDNIGEGSNLYYTDARVSTYLSTNSYATEGYVTTAVSNLVAAAPSTLDTLNELAAALGDDPNFATTVTNSIATKLPLAGGTLTGGLHINTTSLPQLLIQNADGGTNAERIAIELNAGDIFKIRSLNDNNTTRVDNIITANILNGNIGIGTSSPRARMSFPNIVDTNGYDIGTLRFYDNGSSIFYGIGVSDSQFNLRAGTTTDGFAFWAGQSHRMQIDGSGNVGIATASPSEKLHIKGGLKLEDATDTTTRDHVLKVETNGALSFTDSVDGERLRVDYNGNIGVGTNTPTEKLHIVGGDIGVNSTQYREAGLIAYGNTDYYVVTANAYPLLFKTTNIERMRIDANGNVGIGNTSPGDKLVVSNGNIDLGGTSALFKFSNGGANTYMNEGWGIRLNGDATHPVGVTNASFEVGYISNGANRGTGNLLVSGNVGVGTTSPAYKLDVNSTSGVGISVANGGYNWLSLTSGYTGAASIGINDSGGSGNLAIYQYNSSGAYVRTALRLTDAGNVGIGTTTPADSLVVIGDIGVGVGGYNGGIFANNTAGAVDKNWGFEIQRTSGVSDYNTRIKYYPVTGEARKAGIYNARSGSYSLYSDSNNDPNIIIPSGSLGIGITSTPAKLNVNGASDLNGVIKYRKVYGSIDTTGNVVARLIQAGNGASAFVKFECYGGGGYQRIVYNCLNYGNNWICTKQIDEGANGFDVTATSGIAAEFTFKGRTNNQGYSPSVSIEGTALDPVYYP